MTTQKPAPGRANPATNGAGRPKVVKTAGPSIKEAPRTPTPKIPWEPLKVAKTIDDVISNFDQVIDWAIRAESTIGYFAILYKRSTLAVHQAISEGKFQNPERMKQFDAVFAQRYFYALNAYFRPDKYPGLTLPWEVAFVGHVDGTTTMIQQMMTGLNAHICFDLGLAAAAVAGNDLASMHHDFEYIDTLVAYQIPDMLKALIKRSPEVVWLRRAIPDQQDVIKAVLTRFRDGSWLFANYLVMYPDKANEKIVNHLAWTAALGAWYLQPPKQTQFHWLIWFIKRRENRDVAGNLKALNKEADKPPRMTPKPAVPILGDVMKVARVLAPFRAI
jgi:hypothetical protein